MKLFPNENSLAAVHVVKWAAMKEPFRIRPQPGRKVVTCRIAGTSDDQVGWVITPLMSLGLMPSTVAGSTGQNVRTGEQTERANCGREKAEMGYDTNPSSPDMRAAGGQYARLLATAHDGCSHERRTASQTLSDAMSHHRRQ